MYILLFATLLDLQSAQLKNVKERTRMLKLLPELLALHIACGYCS